MRAKILIVSFFLSAASIALVAGAVDEPGAAPVARAEASPAPDESKTTVEKAAPAATTQAETKPQAEAGEKAKADGKSKTDGKAPDGSALPTFPSEVELVTVDIVVADKKGKPVAGLKKEDFLLSEGGEPQAISSFEAVELPALPSQDTPRYPPVSTNTSAEVRGGRTFAVLFDDIHLTHANAQRAQVAVAEFFRQGVREGDRVLLVATSGGAWWSARMEQGREEMLELVKRLEGRRIYDLALQERMTDYEALRIIQYHDTEVGTRVFKRFESAGLTQRMNESSSSTGTDQSSTSSSSSSQLGINEGVENAYVLGRANEVYQEATMRNRMTLQAITRILDALTTTRGRKSLILVSQGFIYDPNLSEMRDTIQASRRANVAIYFLSTMGLDIEFSPFSAELGQAIAPQDIGPMYAEAGRDAEGAEGLADATGGFSVKNSNDLGAGITRIANESRAYYLLGYNPKQSFRDGRFRKIEIKVNRKGTIVRARKGYYAPEEKAAAKPLKPGEAPPELQRALDAPFEIDDIPMRLSAYVFEEGLIGRARVKVAADVDLRKMAFEEKDGRFVDSLDTFLIVSHRETGETFSFPELVGMKLRPETKAKTPWYSLDREFQLASGHYQARLVTRDHNSTKVGSVFHGFIVPDLGAWRVSSLVLYDDQEPRNVDSTYQQSRYLARRDFPRDRWLFCRFEVYNSVKDKESGLPRVSQGHIVRAKGGVEIRSSALTPIIPTPQGGVTRLVGFPLEGFEPGDYELVLQLKDELSGKSQEVVEPFTVVAGS
jgi:VWFA-related protein